jgi:valyl-tRNA synthetase
MRLKQKFVSITSTMKEVPESLMKPFDAASVEAPLYTMWEESGYFNPDNLPGERKESFTIVLPPPNVTGVLHLGHAYEDSLQDTIIRFQRMRGKRALWLPGTDSAAIATQARVEKDIQKKEGRSRHDLGREELVKRVHEFAKQSENTILSQVKKLGASLDWSRYAYTLDEKRNLAVFTAFKRMYDAGLIYKGNRIVNWDPKGQTTISDDEVVYVEEKSKFYYFKYGPFTIGTARPETKFGDKYVVMHPDDERYKEYSHGQKLTVEWINGPIEATIIKDESADPEFGTGVMTITPWHSQVDFDLAKKYDLDYEQIIDKYGKLLPIAAEFAGMKIKDAREKIVEKLQAKGLVEKIEDYVHNVSTAERTGGIIEPQIMEQWFMAVDKPFILPHSEMKGIESGAETTLKEIMRNAVLSGDVSMPQENFRKMYINWINNLHDWCISRQIWFGHRIPVWYKGDEVYCGVTAPTGDGWEQEPDVLDTWFSSALWTFSTLGWPEDTKDVQQFHPTAFMSPAYEILSLWVSRMILMSGFHLGQVPFKTVMFHGIVRDKQGRKFSKSLDNGIDPLDMIAKYGTDALRMGLLSGTAIGNDMKFGEDKVKAYKLFGNKIWNGARFVLEKTADLESETEFNAEDQAVYDAWQEIRRDITEDIENYRLHLASEKIYDYFWKTFCDEIIETRKVRIANDTDKGSAQTLLLVLLREQLIVLHPFMPFITEELWKYIKKDTDDMLMVTRW